jgi:hypothetical protein
VDPSLGARWGCAGRGRAVAAGGGGSGGGSSGGGDESGQVSGTREARGDAGVGGPALVRPS